MEKTDKMVIRAQKSRGHRGTRWLCKNQIKMKTVGEGHEGWERSPALNGHGESGGGGGGGDLSRTHEGNNGISGDGQDGQWFLQHTDNVPFLLKKTKKTTSIGLTIASWFLISLFFCIKEKEKNPTTHAHQFAIPLITCNESALLKRK